MTEFHRIYLNKSIIKQCSLENEQRSFDEFLNKIHPCYSQAESFSISDIKKYIYEQLESKMEKKCYKMFRDMFKVRYQGLDNNEIDFTKIKHNNKGKMSYEQHYDLTSVTFLISGYLTKEEDAQSNFQNLKEISNDPNNLFVNLRWESNDPTWLIKSFLESLAENLLFGQSTKFQDAQIFLENYIKESLDKLQCRPILKKLIYYIIMFLLMVLRMQFDTIFDTFLRFFQKIIVNFKETIENARSSGCALKIIIQKLQLNHPKLSILLMGHSLGTVVIEEALNAQYQKPIKQIILMGGVARIEDITKNDQSFNMCVNFYSSNDKILSELVSKGGLIRGEMTGLNPFGEILMKYKNEQTYYGHQEYSRYYLSLFKKALSFLEQQEYQNYQYFQNYSDEYEQPKAPTYSTQQRNVLQQSEYQYPQYYDQKIEYNQPHQHQQPNRIPYNQEPQYYQDKYQQQLEFLQEQENSLAGSRMYSPDDEYFYHKFENSYYKNLQFNQPNQHQQPNRVPYNQELYYDKHPKQFQFFQRQEDTLAESRIIQPTQIQYSDHQFKNEYPKLYDEKIELNQLNEFQLNLISQNGQDNPDYEIVRGTYLPIKKNKPLIIQEIINGRPSFKMSNS